LIKSNWSYSIWHDQTLTYTDQICSLKQFTTKILQLSKKVPSVVVKYSVKTVVSTNVRLFDFILRQIKSPNAMC
jgi:hypothetical protein